MNGIETITAERRSQVIRGMDSEHDSKHTAGELAKAAACYLTAAVNLTSGKSELVFKGTGRDIEPLLPKAWPFEADTWKPSQVAKNNLKKAAALIAAEWDRLDLAGM